MGLVDICLFGRNAAAQVRAGTIKELRGTAVVHRNGRSIAATAAMPILAGDKLETSPQSTVTIGLIDGGELILSEASSVLIDHTLTSAAGSTIELFKGKLRSLVNIAAGNLRRFEVRTPNACGLCTWHRF